MIFLWYVNIHMSYYNSFKWYVYDKDNNKNKEIYTIVFFPIEPLETKIFKAYLIIQLVSPSILTTTLCMLSFYKYQESWLFFHHYRYILNKKSSLFLLSMLMHQKMYCSFLILMHNLFQCLKKAWLFFAHYLSQFFKNKFIWESFYF